MTKSKDIDAEIVPDDAPLKPWGVLVRGDALVRETFSEGCADLIVTSPPYNLGKEYSGVAVDDDRSRGEYIRFLQVWLANCLYWCRPYGRLCVNVAVDTHRGGKFPLSAAVVQLARQQGWSYQATVLWDKGVGARRISWGSWLSARGPHLLTVFEHVLVFYKTGWRKPMEGLSSVSKKDFLEWVSGHWLISPESATRLGHEAPFPRGLPRRCIGLFSYIGETVLDPFSGSGTTVLESVLGGRHGIGLECEDTYCALAVKRMETDGGLMMKPRRSEDRFVDRLGQSVGFLPDAEYWSVRRPF